MTEISKMIEELYKAFDKANEVFWENSLPKPMIIISRKSSKWELGFITVHRLWVENKELPEVKEGEEIPEEAKPETRYEINISAEGLNRPIEEILCTLVHEMVHEFHLEAGIKDTSQKIHNKKFKAEAERCGLIVEKGQGVGWGSTSPGSDFLEVVKSWGIDDSVFSFVRIGDLKEKTKKKQTKFKYTNPNDPKMKFTCKFDVEVIDKDTGETFEQELIEEDGDE